MSDTTVRKYSIFFELYHHEIKPRLELQCGCCHAERSSVLGAQCGPPLTQQCPAAWMDRDQTGDERRTMENKGQVGAITGVGERAVDSRASMTQNQSSVSGQTSQPVSVWGSVTQRRKKNERTKQNLTAWLGPTTSVTPFYFWSQKEKNNRLPLWSMSRLNNTTRTN